MYIVMICEVLYICLVNRVFGYVEGICNLRMRMRFFIKMIIVIMREICCRFYFFYCVVYVIWMVNCWFVDVIVVIINWWCGKFLVYVFFGKNFNILDKL